MTNKNSTIATLDYIAVTQFDVPEHDGFFYAEDHIQDLVLKEFKKRRHYWRVKALS